jgi:voltage-gated potassium channel Kch
MIAQVAVVASFAKLRGPRVSQSAMSIFRVINTDLGNRRLRDWHRGVRRTLVMLMLVVTACALGLALLDGRDMPLEEKVLLASWNALNLISTLGDFTGIDHRQRVFMIGTMMVFIMIGGYAVSRLTGILSSDAVLQLRENRTVKNRIDQLSDHVIVIGFQTIGELVANRLRDAGRTVVVVERAEGSAEQAAELGYLVVQGDAGADDGVFASAGLDRANALVVTTEEPDRVVAITLMAHAINPQLAISVTVPNRARGALLKRAGATQIIVADDIVAGALIGSLALPAQS